MGFLMISLNPIRKRINEIAFLEKGIHPVWFVFFCFWLPFGAVLGLLHIVFAGLLAITYVGLPFAKIHFKLAQFTLLPCVLKQSNDPDLLV